MLAQMVASLSLIQSQILFVVIIMPIVYYSESRETEHLGLTIACPDDSEFALTQSKKYVGVKIMPIIILYCTESPETERLG